MKRIFAIVLFVFIVAFSANIQSPFRALYETTVAQLTHTNSAFKFSQKFLPTKPSHRNQF